MIERAARGVGLVGVALVMAACGSGRAAPAPAMPPTPASPTEAELGAIGKCGTPGQAVSMTLTLIVNKSGGVASLSANSDDPGREDPAITRCVVAQAAGWKFPAASGSSILHVPLRFVGSAT